MSLVEVLVSAALSIVLSGAVLSLVVAGQTLARTQPDSLDLQQRARVAMQVIAADLRDAGAGVEHGDLAGPLARYFPPIAPSPDGGITLWTATSPDAQGTAAFAVSAGTTLVTLRDSPVCPDGEPACGFTPGAIAIAFTAGGCRTTIRVGTAGGAALQLAAPLTGCTLDAGAAVAEGTVRTYRVDPVARQLIRRDEATGSSAPLVDGVASLTAAFFADAAGDHAIAGTSDAALMAVRRVRLTLRFVAANPLLRIPDLDVVVDAVPRNLQGGGAWP